jgi:hypothetical protein
MYSDTIGMLQAAALMLLGRVEQLAPGTVETELALAVSQALAHYSPKVRAAAFDVLSRVGDISPEVNLELALTDPDEGVRRQVLKVLHARCPARLAELLPTVVDDSSYSVRMLVISTAVELGEEEVLVRMANSDPDAYLRGLARQGVSQITRQE